MKKGKILFIIFIVFLLILIAVFVRNYFLLSKALATLEPTDNFKCTLVSYSSDQIEEKTHTLYIKKDQISKSITSKPQYTEITTWRNEQTDEGLSLSSTDRTAYTGKSSEFSTLTSLPSFATIIEGNSDFHLLVYSMTHIIPAQKLDGKPCTLISIGHESYWVDQETGLIRKIVSKDDNQVDHIMEYQNIEINVVSDKDVEKPDLTDYSLKSIQN